MAGSERGKGREEHGRDRRPIGDGTDGRGGTSGGGGGSSSPEEVIRNIAEIVQFGGGHGKGL